MNKAGNNGGIGFIGVMLALFLFFFIRGCIIENHQQDINNFCKSKGFDYGEETIESTLIECDYWNQTKIEFDFKAFRYKDFEEARQSE